VNGSPAFELTPLFEDDDLINQLIENNPSFRQLLKERLDRPTITSEEMSKRLNKRR